MENPIPFERLFTKKLFRIPDYQRGYAWQREQLRAFWEDLVNLKEDRSHYTGVLTLTEVKSVERDSKEFWLVNDHSYRLYHVVDGQQRLTTFIIFIQAFTDFFRSLPENQGLSAREIYVTEDSLTLADIEECYLFRINPRVGFRTYMFGYTEDNPSQEYLSYRILGEQGGGEVHETFYTLNLGYAKNYFSEQIAELHTLQGTEGLAALFKKLTKHLLFNEYSINDEFDVFVAFETMNNRGKKLSDLELLKNRLIYLTTLYGNDQLDVAGLKALRDSINSAWKEVYSQLGRNKTKPLNDDDFLRAHWISYFKYSRDTGRDYARFLLDEHFTPQNVHDIVERDVPIEAFEEQRSEVEVDDGDDAAISSFELPVIAQGNKLSPDAIRDFVASLRASAQHWFNSFYPYHATNMSEAEQSAIDRLNRIGMGYFRPLVMVILKKVEDENGRIRILGKIERFIFIAFRIGTARSNYQSSVFYNLVRKLDLSEISLDDISQRLDVALDYAFNKDDKKTLRIDEFYNILFKKFEAGSGYYGWKPQLNYFLYEYEQSLLDKSRQQKVEWGGLLKSENDRISIEHIYPQTPTAEWEVAFKDVPANERVFYAGSIGNLLLLSMSINASLQNYAFIDKKWPKRDASKNKVRNGYSDGSHSEIEVASSEDWGPKQIKDRGERLLKFMETRWGFTLRDEDRTKLLFLERTK
ncbi:MAG: DUF262 domain-containing protein [Rugosibacter sp.]|nr:DUF262 domain-containing protein [Rugosibacter sp.]